MICDYRVKRQRYGADKTGSRHKDQRHAIETEDSRDGDKYQRQSTVGAKIRDGRLQTEKETGHTYHKGKRLQRHMTAGICIQDETSKTDRKKESRHNNQMQKTAETRIKRHASDIDQRQVIANMRNTDQT